MAPPKTATPCPRGTGPINSCEEFKSAGYYRHRRTRKRAYALQRSRSPQLPEACRPRGERSRTPLHRVERRLRTRGRPASQRIRVRRPRARARSRVLSRRQHHRSRGRPASGICHARKKAASMPSSSLSTCPRSTTPAATKLSRRSAASTTHSTRCTRRTHRLGLALNGRLISRACNRRESRRRARHRGQLRPGRRSRTFSARCTNWACAPRRSPHTTGTSTMPMPAAPPRSGTASHRTAATWCAR